MLFGAKAAVPQKRPLQESPDGQASAGKTREKGFFFKAFLRLFQRLFRGFLSFLRGFLCFLKGPFKGFS